MLWAKGGGRKLCEGYICCMYQIRLLNDNDDIHRFTAKNTKYDDLFDVAFV